MNNEQYFLTEQDIESFDELFSKELSKEEYAALRSKLEADEVFNYKLVLYKSLRKEIEQESANSEMLKIRFRKIDAKEKTTKKIIWLSMSIAASLAIIVTISVRFYSANTDTDKAYQMVYNTYKDSEPGLPVIMAKTNLQLLDSAMIEYTGRRFDKALYLLNKAPGSDTILYYQGVCNEQLNNDSKAETLYKQTVNSQSSFIAHKANYRLGLLYMKDHNQKYKSIIDEIAKDDTSPYQENANKIKSMLGKN
jgi:hypothetical protein